MKGPELSHFHLVRAQQEEVICETGRELSTDTESVGTLILDFQPPELGEINVCCLNLPVCRALLW